MPSSSGPNTVSDSSIVFNYDNGDVANSYKGEPTINYWNGNQFSIYNDGATNIRNSTDIAPPLSGYEVVKVTANTIGSYGQCILWNATYPNNNVATITNSIYAYLTVGDYVQVGQHWFPWYYGTQKNITKNQWVRISETYTINEGNSYGNAALTYSTNGIAYFAMPQYEYKSYATPFIGANQTRSNTQGLLDISGRGNNISLSNVSFNSSGIVFDGTDDYISIDNSSALQVGDVFTISAWVFPTNLNSRQGVFTTRRNNATGCWQIEVGTASGGINRVAVTGIGTWIFETPDNIISPNTWTNICFVKSGNGIQGGILYVNGVAISPQVTTAYNIANNSDVKVVGAGTSLGSPFPGRISNVALYNRILTATEVANNYIELRGRFDAPIYTYSEGNSASSYVSNWNNSTTYTMADFGGIPNVNAHGFSSGPVTFTLTLNNLPPHTRIRYKVLWHLVDSLDNETNQLFIMNSSGGETEILRFTKQYNLTPAISVAASPGTYTWSGAKSYTYRPWAGGAYGADGYIIVDSGLVNHTSTTFTARHVMGADQAQADEAEYLSHVLVELY
jgi:hypothetical protein